MTSLYYDTLGNIGQLDPTFTIPQVGFGMLNTGGFQNIVLGPYWNNTYDFDPAYGWLFDAAYGYQATYVKVGGGGAYGIAVHDGDVTGSTAPNLVSEPQSLALAVAALCVAGAARRLGARRKRLAAPSGLAVLSSEESLPCLERSQ
jgi:hypothetical protein